MAHLSLIPRMWLRKHGISTNTRSEVTIYQQEVFDNDSVSLGTSPYTINHENHSPDLGAPYFQTNS